MSAGDASLELCLVKSTHMETWPKQTYLGNIRGNVENIGTVFAGNVGCISGVVFF